MKHFPIFLFFIGIAFVAGPSALLADAHTSRALTVMKFAFDVAVLAVSLFVIRSKRYEPTDKHWAYLTVGTILGFYLNVK
jgi:hypothetical protein